MSKKKFTAGLESLFGDASNDTLPEENPLLSGREKPAATRPAKASDARPSSGKDFTSELQSFLETSFEESLERQLKEKEKTPKAANKKRRHRPSGLDLLIQRTVDKAEQQPENPHKGLGKRITLLLDQEKLEKLKEIARQERTYLRNIIDEIVAEYIKSYDKRKPQPDH